MIIQATEKEVDLIIPLAEQFSDSSRFVGFKSEILIDNIKNIISSKLGVLFLYMDNGKPIGTICGMKYPDLYSGILTATELFWFVESKSRGIGIRLLNKFERWSKEQGCRRIIMHPDLMPEIVKKIYIKRGYELLESHFIKEL